jgi:hypothetical protein
MRLPMMDEVDTVLARVNLRGLASDIAADPDPQIRTGKIHDWVREGEGEPAVVADRKRT